MSVRKCRHPLAPIRLRLGRGAKLLGIVMSLLLLGVPLAGPAYAEFDVGAPVPNSPRDVTTDIEITSTGAGQAITGALPPEGQPWPIDTYPTSIPPGYVPDNVDFSGIINTADVTGGNTAQMYCIDLRTDTVTGVGYANGSWDEGNVPNIGYANRILNTYYPSTDLPSGLGTNQKAAAVQAAIWFFTDGYVLNPGDPLATAVATIVNDTIAAGPLTEPDAPDISITPPAAAGPAGGTSGPFTAVAEAGELTVVPDAGYSLYSDPAGTVPLDSPIPSGTQFWVRSDSGGLGPGTVHARAVVTVQTGNVYLYDGASPGRDTAQKLILAVTRELSSSAEASAAFYETGSLAVTKAIAGPAAGSQADVVINVDCGPGFQFVFAVPAGTTGSVTETFTGIPAGSLCTLTEPETGATQSVQVTTTLPEPVEITANITAAATVTDSYAFAPGSLLVRKAIAGPAAGAQAEIRISVTCLAGGAVVLEETVSIPAGSVEPAVAEYAGLPAGSNCSVTELADGSGDAVRVSVTGGGSVTVPAGAAAEIAMTNTYELVAVDTRPASYGKRQLPETGAGDSMGLLVLGSGLALAGGAAVLISRLRRPGRG